MFGEVVYLYCHLELGVSERQSPVHKIAGGRTNWGSERAVNRKGLRPSMEVRKRTCGSTSKVSTVLSIVQNFSYFC